MNQLSRESLRAPRKLRTQAVDVPELDGSVTIRELDYETAQALGKAVNESDKDAMLRWVIASVVDGETGEVVYTLEDLPFLSSLSAAAIVRISQAAIKLSNIDAATTAKN